MVDGHGEPIVLDPKTRLTIDGLADVAGGRAVSLSPLADERLAAARAVVEETLAADIAAYGLNTGLGDARDRRVSERALLDYQKAIIRLHAGGIGPALPATAVRAAMAVRVNSAIRGGSGIRPRTARMLVDMLNAGVHPVVPAIGSVGASDLMHLAAIALVLIGDGEAEVGGRVLPGREAMAQAGLEPLELAPLEGLALISANSMAAGHGAIVVRRAEQLVATADAVVALSLEAIDGNLSVIDAQVGMAKPVPGQIEALDHLNRLLAGSRLFEEGAASSLQDPLSFRVVPQVHGAAREFVRFARQAVEIELNAMDDNPLVSIAERRLLSNGNFHPMAMALSFDAVRPALTHLGLCSIRRMNHLTGRHLGAVSQFEALTNAMADESPRGLSTYAAAALFAEVRHLAGPATLDIQSLDLEQEDHATAAPNSIAVTERVIDLLQRILAVELDCASSVIDRTQTGQLGRGAEVAHRLVKTAVAASESPTAAAINDRIVELLDRGDFLREVDAAAALS